MTRRRTANTAANVMLVWALFTFFTTPAEAHARCDHTDHTHRRYTWNRTWTERWRYLGDEVMFEHGRTVDYQIWSVDGQPVRDWRCR